MLDWWELYDSEMEVTWEAWCMNLKDWSSDSTCRPNLNLNAITQTPTVVRVWGDGSGMGERENVVI